MLISLYLFLSIDYALQEGRALLFTNLHSQCPAQCLVLEYLSFDLNLKRALQYYPGELAHWSPYLHIGQFKLFPTLPAGRKAMPPHFYQNLEGPVLQELLLGGGLLPTHTGVLTTYSTTVHHCRLLSSSPSPNNQSQVALLLCLENGMAIASCIKRKREDKTSVDK